MTRWLTGVAVLVVGCVGSHPLERPLVVDCDTAFESGQQGDPCDFVGECAMAMDLGATRRAALCANASLLIARVEEREESGAAPCPGERHDESDADVSFVVSGVGCVEVTFCNELLGGATALRIAELCQIGARPGPAAGSPHESCTSAVREGTDGDACVGDFACIQVREISPGSVLPVVGWCDAGSLRLAPSQTLIHGVP